MEGGKFAEKLGKPVGRALDGEVGRVEGTLDAQDRMGSGVVRIVQGIGRHDFEKARGGGAFRLGIVGSGPFPAELILQAGNRQAVIGAEIGLGLTAVVKRAQQRAPLFGGSSLGHPEV